jgi:DNA-directed RNA polymerase subunit RPC12/RpoP
VLPVEGKSGNERKVPRNGASAPQKRGQIQKKRGRARQGPTPGWTLEPHVCRECFGRLLSQPRARGHRLYVCANCGTEALGRAADVLCACGLKLRNHGPGAPLVDAGLRCQPNPEPRPEFPSLFVAAEPRT